MDAAGFGFRASTVAELSNGTHVHLLKNCDSGLGPCIVGALSLVGLLPWAGHLGIGGGVSAPQLCIGAWECSFDISKQQFRGDKEFRGRSDNQEHIAGATHKDDSDNTGVCSCLRHDFECVPHRHCSPG